MPVAEEVAPSHHHPPAGKAPQPHDERVSPHHLEDLTTARQHELAMEQARYDVPGGELDFDSDDDPQRGRRVNTTLTAAEQEIKNSLLRMLL